MYARGRPLKNGALPFNYRGNPLMYSDFRSLPSKNKRPLLG
jgi:hypothetical protein